MLSLFDSYKAVITAHICSLRMLLEDPLQDSMRVKESVLMEAQLALETLRKMFESHFTTSSTKVSYILHLKRIDGTRTLLDLLDKSKYDLIALEAVAVVGAIMKIPEGAAEIDGRLGREILQRCSKRFPNDEFIPFEVEYALELLNKQQKAIRHLADVALKKAIEEQKLENVLLMLASNVDNLNVALPSLLGVLKMVNQEDGEILSEMCAKELWLRLIVKAIDTHNRVEDMMCAGATLLTLIAQQTEYLRRFVAKEGGLGIAVRSLYVYSTNRDVGQQLVWCLDEFAKDRQNIRDFVVLSGDKALEEFIESRKTAKIHIFIPKRLIRLIKEMPRIRNDLKRTGNFTFQIANYGKALDTVTPISITPQKRTHTSELEWF